MCDSSNSSPPECPKHSALDHSVNNDPSLEVLQATAFFKELWVCYRKVIFQKYVFFYNFILRNSHETYCPLAKPVTLKHTKT